MDGSLVIWIGTGSLAVLMLLSMMRRRQLHLIGLLKEYVERQATWARRRAKAAQIAAEQSATENKAPGQ